VNALGHARKGIDRNSAKGRKVGGYWLAVTDVGQPCAKADKCSVLPGSVPSARWIEKTARDGCCIIKACAS
jgi:hypothetical protein